MDTSRVEMHTDTVIFQGLRLTCREAAMVSSQIVGDGSFARVDIENNGELGMTLLKTGYPGAIDASVGSQAGTIDVVGLPENRVVNQAKLIGKKKLVSLHNGDEFSLISGGTALNFRVDEI